MLRSHIAQVIAASRAILDGLSLCAWTEGDAREQITDLARLHDLGKGSAAFQRYIAAPEAWQGSAREKAHTPLSLALTTHYAYEQGWSAPRALSAALAVRGHHGGLPSQGERLSRDLCDDELHPVLMRQLASLDLDALRHATGLRLAAWESPEELIDGVCDALEEQLLAVRRLSIRELTRWRVHARAAFSVLLEADKAMLAIDRPHLRAYLHRRRIELSVEAVDELVRALPSTPMDALRTAAWSDAREGIACTAGSPLRTLTLPTGVGKTLIAARWALGLRGGERPPTIIVALPMLSIVDQTEAVWRSLFDGAEGDVVLASHSISDRSYNSETEQGTADFYLDTWRSEVIITTFDQLLLAMFSDRSRHAMRYHRLLNARIILDEVQCVPPILWESLSRGLRALCEEGSTQVLAMSATQPGCIAGAVEVMREPTALFETLDRYRIELEHDRPCSLATLAERVTEAASAGERVLATVNTRASAQLLFSLVSAALHSMRGPAPALLSGDLTPRHRLSVTDAVRRGEVRVLVSTQCVEAGVDIDMDRVFRDQCPLDALVQIAGRCNRHARRDSPGIVVFLDLRPPHGEQERAWIYDEVAWACTEEVLRGRRALRERDVFGLCASWFERIAARKNLGAAYFERWARVIAPLDVRRMLRGDDRGSHEIVVIEQDPRLYAEWSAALALDDRWERRSALRALAPRVSAVSVSVSERRFGRWRTREWGGLTLLDPGQYDPNRGLMSEHVQ